jgi:hypothetical protein
MDLRVRSTNYVVFGFGAHSGIDEVPELMRLAEQADRDGLDLFSLSDHPYLGGTQCISGFANGTNLPTRPAPMLARTVTQTRSGRTGWPGNPGHPGLLSPCGQRPVLMALLAPTNQATPPACIPCADRVDEMWSSFTTAMPPGRAATVSGCSTGNPQGWPRGPGSERAPNTGGVLA